MPSSVTITLSRATHPMLLTVCVSDMLAGSLSAGKVYSKIEFRPRTTMFGVLVHGCPTTDTTSKVLSLRHLNACPACAMKILPLRDANCQLSFVMVPALAVRMGTKPVGRAPVNNVPAVVATVELGPVGAVMTLRVL